MFVSFGIAFFRGNTRQKPAVGAYSLQRSPEPLAGF